MNSEQSCVPCCNCGGPVVEFSIDNKNWNSIIRTEGKEHDQEYLCIHCFADGAALCVARLAAERARVQALVGLVREAYETREYITVDFTESKISNQLDTIMNGGDAHAQGDDA